MKLNELTALGPLDGRYRSKTDDLAPYFSEYALIKYRVVMEIRYFQALCKLPIPGLKKFPAKGIAQLDSIVDNFGIKEARRIKTFERTTNHDVKAVEYFLKEQFDHFKWGDFKEFIHFGLTSQDINNTAIPLSLREAHKDVIAPAYQQILKTLKALSRKWKNVPMLARTHGQPASPTSLGKEIEVYVSRLSLQLETLNQVPFAAKFGGATGNFNAHVVAFPKINWISFSDRLLKKLGLARSQPTTQIEHYDFLAAYLDNIKRINTILVDLSRDVWQYIAMHYFTQKIQAGEVGSSTMPHKVNPIDFENAEGNLGIANALCVHLSGKLPISRLQRDLTDSTVLRNLGMPLGHTLLAAKSLLKGFSKIEVDKKTIRQDLDDNWAVVGEAIQTILRREGYPNPYEALKALTRNNQKITAEELNMFVENLAVSDKVKAELKAITPFNYIGV